MREVEHPEEYRYITVLFDCEDTNGRKLLAAFQDSFGDTEEAYPPQYLCLHLYPGGALEMAT